MNSKLMVLTWDEFFEDSASLAEKVRNSGYKPDLLVAIARGGWILGRILSDVLLIREVVSLTMRSYESIENRSPETTVLQPMNFDLRGRRVLIVDDIVDTGLTLKVAFNMVYNAGASEARTAALYVKSRSTFKPDYFIRLVDKWVVFPYEYCETASELRNNGVGLDELIKMGFEKELLDSLCKMGVGE